MASDINIKTLVTSVVRPYMVGLKTYYSELHNKMLAKIQDQDRDILTSNEVTAALTARVVELEHKLLIANENIVSLKEELVAVNTRLKGE